MIVKINSNKKYNYPWMYGKVLEVEDASYEFNSYYIVSEGRFKGCLILKEDCYNTIRKEIDGILEI